MKTLIIFLLSVSFALAQKDTTIVSQKVVKFGDKFVVETKTTTTIYKSLDAEIMRKVEDLENENTRIESEKLKKIEERKELIKLIRQALNQGYKPNSDNDFDDKLFNRVIDKARKEKIN